TEYRALPPTDALHVLRASLARSGTEVLSVLTIIQRVLRQERRPRRVVLQALLRNSRVHCPSPSSRLRNRSVAAWPTGWPGARATDCCSQVRAAALSPWTAALRPARRNRSAAAAVSPACWAAAPASARARASPR